MLAQPKISLRYGEQGFEEQVRAYVRANFARRQLDIGLDCTAAARVDGVWYVGANNVWLRPSYFIQVSKEFGEFVPYEIAEFKIPNLHAEMKVLKLLKEKGKLRKGKLAIGVSKPCCPQCVEILTRIMHEG